MIYVYIISAISKEKRLGIKPTPRGEAALSARQVPREKKKWFTDKNNFHLD